MIPPSVLLLPVAQYVHFACSVADMNAISGERVVAYAASLSRTYRLMTAAVVTPTVIDDLCAELTILHELAGHMPPTIWRQPLHYTKHFPQQMKEFGPSPGHSMWGYEDMFGHLKANLHSRKHPVVNVLKGWGSAFALRTLTAYRDHMRLWAANGVPPPFQPNNRFRSDKSVVKVGAKIVKVTLLGGVKCAHVKAWYRQQEVYVGMEHMHASAKAQLAAQPDSHRYIQPYLLTDSYLLHALVCPTTSLAHDV